MYRADEGLYWYGAVDLTRAVMEADLLSLPDGMISEGATHVAMASTGVFE